MMRVCMADGEIKEEEQQWITYFSGLLAKSGTNDKLCHSLDASICADS